MSLKAEKPFNISIKAAVSMTSKIHDHKINVSRKVWHKPQLNQTPTSQTAFSGGNRADGKFGIS
jgi:hypothetical protein